MNKSESKYFNTAVKMNKALIEILAKKDFEYISIKEICDKAGVNRSTFYLHYENTRDLLDESVRYMLDRFLSYFSFDKYQKTDFQNKDLSELVFISSEYIHPYLNFIKENKRLFLTAQTHSDSMGFDKVYRRLYSHIFDPILDRFEFPEESRKYVMLFYLNGITAIVTQWINDGCDKSIESITEIISECIFGRANGAAEYKPL